MVRLDECTSQKWQIAREKLGKEREREIEKKKKKNGSREREIEK
jgi:hypothetical protein